MSIRKIALLAAFSLLMVGATAAQPAGASPAAQSAKKPAAKAPVKKAAVAARVPFGYGVQVHAPDGDQTVIDHVKDMGFNWVKQQTVYTRWGDWFPLLCASLALLGLVAERIA